MTFILVCDGLVCQGDAWYFFAGEMFAIIGPMALAKVNSGATVGLDSVPIEVEVNIESHGFPAFNIVGLPDKAVEEAKERVRSALKNTGADFPARRITVNLAPADLPKQGPAYDLPIALGIMLASGQLTADVSQALVFGELSLDGSLRSTPGTLPLCLLAEARGWQDVYLPADNTEEASLVAKIRAYALKTLGDFFRHLNKTRPLTPKPPTDPQTFLSQPSLVAVDFKDIQGQEHVKRVLEIAAAGGHNVAMKGPPGAGKTLLARALPSILPRLTWEEALEVTKIYSITGRLTSQTPVVWERPFRSPHHTTSRIGLIGGGTQPQPGEISLAHRGVLFLDEFPEFPRHVLEALRQPVEDGVVTVSRAAGSLTFPAKFTLVVASNPCQCGYLGDPKHNCTCSPSQIIHYQKRVSGPLLDRIDLHVEVPAVEIEKLTTLSVSSEPSPKVRERVQAARDHQVRRYQNLGLTCNAELSSAQVREFCPLSAECLTMLRQAVNSLGLSARGYYRVIKLARTIADLAGEEQIAPAYLAEALQSRPRQEL